MTDQRIERVGVRAGYDLWADTYEQTPNPVVRMDARHTIHLLAPRADERILDAGCGTGRNFAPILRAGSQLIGTDFSRGMMQVAQRAQPNVPLVQSDLQQPLPFRAHSFDAVLCALIGEHLTDLSAVFANFHALLQQGGRLVFSVYHPAMAEAGKEAHFEREGVEYRLGAERHRVDDYRRLLTVAGFAAVRQHEFNGDEQLATDVPSKARRLIGFPVLLVFEATRGSGSYGSDSNDSMGNLHLFS